MTRFARTAKNRINRLPKRGHYERETIYRILDEALICHVGFRRKWTAFCHPDQLCKSG